MTSSDCSKLIQRLLRDLGATENYTAFFPTVYAVQFSIDCPDRLRLVTKRIYPDVARRYNTNWRAVERNMRTLVSAAWENAPMGLSELAGFPLRRKPTNAQFLAILTGFCTQIIV